MSIQLAAAAAATADVVIAYETATEGCRRRGEASDVSMQRCRESSLLSVVSLARTCLPACRAWSTPQAATRRPFYYRIIFDGRTCSASQHPQQKPLRS